MTRLWPEGELIETALGVQAHGAPGKASALPAPLRGVFVWRGMVHRITRVCNCWRIDTHWWAHLPGALPDAELDTSSSDKPSFPPSEEEADQRSVGEGEGCSVGMDPSSPTLSPRRERRKRAVGGDPTSPTGHPRPDLSSKGERGKRAGTASSSAGDHSLAGFSPLRERRKRLVDVISPIPAAQGEPGASPFGEPNAPPLGEGEGCSVGMDPPSPTGHLRPDLSSRGERTKRAAGSEPAASSASESSSSPAPQVEEKSVWREYVKVTTDTGLLCLLYRDLHDGGWFLARVYD